MIFLTNSGLQYFDFEGSYSLGFTVDKYSNFWAHEQLERPSKKAKLFPIMQYTGLTDKNEKEIYENDIIQFNIDFGYGNCLVIARVIYKDAGFQFESDAGCEYGISNLGEVIGNIYENPELLESIKDKQ